MLRTIQKISLLVLVIITQVPPIQAANAVPLVHTQQRDASYSTPRLRPYTLVHQDPQTDVFSEWSLGGGWIATIQRPYGVSYTKAQNTIHLYNLTTKRWTVVQPTTMKKGLWISGGPVVSRDWVLWEQAENAQNINDWQICLYNIRTKQEWTIDTARAEGIDPHAYQVLPGAGEAALTNDRFAWTTYHVDAQHRTTSILRLANLKTRKIQIIASIPSPHLEANLGWLSMDDHYLVWDQSTNTHDQIFGYDLTTHKMVTFPQTPEASQPAIGYGYLAWKIGPRFGHSTGIAVLNLVTKKRITIHVQNGARPSLGVCSLAYQVLSLGLDGFYDLCTNKGILLDDNQKTWETGEYFGAIQLSGKDIAMIEGNIKEGGYQRDFALFHLSPHHLLYDFYH